MNVEEIRILKVLYLFGDFRMKWYGDILLDLIFKFLKGILKENIIRLYVF